MNWSLLDAIVEAGWKFKNGIDIKSVHFKKTILISFLNVVILTEIKTKSAKMTTLLKQMRITQLSSKTERSL